jgi:hypothetical protein
MEVRSKPDLHFVLYAHGIRSNGAIHSQDLHTTCRCLPQRLAEGRIGRIVGMQVFYMGHLNDKYYIRAVTCRSGLLQMAQMARTPLGGSIREGADTVMLQGYALDLQKTGLSVFVEGKIETGLTVPGLRAKIRNLA